MDGGEGGSVGEKVAAIDGLKYAPLSFLKSVGYHRE